MTDRELANLRFAIQRLKNPGRAAEGSTLPPKQAGNNRILPVTGLELLRARAVTGGTEFTLAWNDVAGAVKYIIHPFLANSDNTLAALTTLPTQTAPRSPATVYIMYNGAGKTVVFKIQTVVGNGMESSLDNSPSCSGKTQ